MKDGSIISNQYRHPGKGMVYELECGDARLVLCAVQSRDPTAEWRFEARLEGAASLVLLGDWKPTRIGAFRALRELWMVRAPSLGLGALDWDRVASSLAQVRALD